LKEAGRIKGRTIVDGRVRILLKGHPRANPMGWVYEHILIAEKALGKPLPQGAEVHHGNGDKTKNCDLVICQDRGYHFLLEQRTRALKSCGHANWRKCKFCKDYDDPEKMVLYDYGPTGRIAFHANCKSKVRKIIRKRRKENAGS
jgi:hypothetical protein